jgi:hypothetical protein
MFLDKKLKSIQEGKKSLSTCCDLRRQLVLIEVRDIYCGARYALSNLSLGLAVAEQILSFIGNRNRR